MWAHRTKVCHLSPWPPNSRLRVPRASLFHTSTALTHPPFSFPDHEYRHGLYDSLRAFFCNLHSPLKGRYAPSLWDRLNGTGGGMNFFYFCNSKRRRRKSLAVSIRVNRFFGMRSLHSKLAPFSHASHSQFAIHSDCTIRIYENKLFPTSKTNFKSGWQSKKCRPVCAHCNSK